MKTRMQLARIAAGILGGWAAIHLYLLSMRAVLLISNGQPLHLKESLPAYAILALIWAVLTPFVVAIVERLRMEEHRLRDAIALIALVPLVSLVASTLILSIFRSPFTITLDRLLLRSISSDGTIAALAVAFAFVIAGNYEATWRERVRAELDALLTHSLAAQMRARLTPRFLFTTLDAIADITPRDPARADRLLGELARLLETFMHFDRAETVTLEEELELADRYARVHPSHVSLRFLVSDDALRTRIPPLMILPLVEALTSHDANAIEVRATAFDDLNATLRTRSELPLEEVRTALGDLHARLRRDGGALTLTRNGEDVIAALRLPLAAVAAA